MDGANDLSLFDIAGYAVGFCPVERVKERSDEVLEIRDLSLMLNLLRGSSVMRSWLAPSRIIHAVSNYSRYTIITRCN